MFISPLQCCGAVNQDTLRAKNVESVYPLNPDDTCHSHIPWATLAYERVLWHGQVRASRTFQWDNKEKVAVCMSRSQLHEAGL